MYKVILDARSIYQVRLPEVEQQDKLVNMAEIFLAYDQSLSLERQSPLASDIAALLQACSPHQDKFKSSETQRTIASENRKRYAEQAYKLLKRIHQYSHFDRKNGGIEKIE